MDRLLRSLGALAKVTGSAGGRLGPGNATSQKPGFKQAPWLPMLSVSSSQKNAISLEHQMIAM